MTRLADHCLHSDPFLRRGGLALVDPFRIDPLRVDPFRAAQLRAAELARAFDSALAFESYEDEASGAEALAPEDREFLEHGRQSQRTPEDTADEQRGAPAVSTRRSRCSTFSTFSAVGDGPTISSTSERIYDPTTGEEREVRRRRIGDQEVTDHLVRKGDDTTSTRRLQGIDEAQLEDFDKHFSAPATPALEQPKQQEAPAPAPAPPPPLQVAPEDVAALSRVLPELSESDATELLRAHDGDLRAAMTAGLLQ